MCAVHYYLMSILLVCVYSTHLKMTTKLHHCCVMYKKNSGIQKQLRVTIYMYYKLDISYMYIVIARALLSKCKNCLLFKIYTENKYT